MTDEPTRELTAREKHDQGLELSDADLRELERPAGENEAAATTFVGDSNEGARVELDVEDDDEGSDNDGDGDAGNDDAPATL